MEPRRRHSHRWPRWLPSPKILLAVATVVVLAILIFKLSSARHDFVRAFSRFRVSEIPWLVAMAAAQGASLLCYSAAQRRLLQAGGSRLRFTTMAALTLAATGIADLVPGGVVPASGWLIDQYRRRDVPVRLAAWTVLAGGFAATVAVLALLLVGAATARLGHPIVIAASGVVLVAGSAGFVVGVHHLDNLECFLRRHHVRAGVKAVHWVSVHVSDLARYRMGMVGGTEVLGLSVANWLFDTLCLAGAFGFLGFGVPWHSVLFAYAVSQVASSLVPLPAGIGVVEGGMVGVLAATGTPADKALVAVVVYRVVNYWAVAAVGSLTALAISHHHAKPASTPSPGRGADGSTESSTEAPPVAARCP